LKERRTKQRKLRRGLALTFDIIKYYGSVNFYILRT